MEQFSQEQSKKSRGSLLPLVCLSHLILLTGPLSFFSINPFHQPIVKVLIKDVRCCLSSELSYASQDSNALASLSLNYSLLESFIHLRAQIFINECKSLQYLKLEGLVLALALTAALSLTFYPMLG